MNSRRRFIRNSTLSAIGLGISAKSYTRIIGANDRIHAAVVGLNGRGMAHISALRTCHNTEIAALCEVDSRIIPKVVSKLSEYGLPSCLSFSDYRKLIENKDIDVVTIASPDHWHAPMGILAMQAGKDVYLEKPCSHNPQEGEWLIKIQAETKRVLQIGNQQRSAPTSKEAVQDIKDGLIGNVFAGKAWYANTRGSIGQGKKTSVPDWLNWELWQGPAPRTDYRDNLVHYNWHWFWNWGTGEINNNGLHEMDICRWALGVDIPENVTSSGGRYSFNDDWEFYDTQIASFTFPENKIITWEGHSCNGMKHHGRDRGLSLHGTDGTIILDRNKYEAFDKSGNLIKMLREKSISATTDLVGIGGLDIYHMRNFIDAIRDGVKLNSPIGEAHKSTLMCHLGNMAQKNQTALKVDVSNGRVLNSPESMQMWTREYAPGWKPTT